MCKTLRAEIFLVGDRGYGRVNRPVGASPRSVIKKMFVLTPFHRRWRLWALNDRRGNSDTRRMSGARRTGRSEQGPSREDSGSAGVDEQGIRRFAAVRCAADRKHESGRVGPMGMASVVEDGVGAVRATWSVRGSARADARSTPPSMRTMWPLPHIGAFAK